MKKEVIIREIMKTNIIMVEPKTSIIPVAKINWEPGKSFAFEKAVFPPFLHNDFVNHQHQM